MENEWKNIIIDTHVHIANMLGFVMTEDMVLESVRKYNLPVVSHTGGCEEAHSKYVYRMAVKHPDVKFVMAHMGLGTDNSEAVDILEKADNLYADTTWVPVIRQSKSSEGMEGLEIIIGSDAYADFMYRNAIDFFNLQLKNTMHE